MNCILFLILIFFKICKKYIHSIHFFEKPLLGGMSPILNKCTAHSFSLS